MSLITAKDIQDALVRERDHYRRCTLELGDQLAKVKADEKKLVDVLLFYGDERHYLKESAHGSQVLQDRGERARKVLIVKAVFTPLHREQCGVAPAPRRTLLDRLESKLFPYVPCEPPNTSLIGEDCIVTRSRSSLSFADRLRVLFTGKVEVETRIVTENAIGQHASNSVVRCGRFT